MFQNATRAIQVKEGQKEPPEISIVAESFEEKQVLVKIRDNGCGISKEDIERIFDPFFTKNDVGEGMGLGLSITYRILNQHRARIEVDSRLGEFTEFSLYFPRETEE